MRLFLSASLALLSLVLAAASSAAEERPSEYRGVAEEMSQGEFRGAGLDKLTPKELTRLDRWIEARTGHASTTPETAAAPERDSEEPATLALDEARAAAQAAEEEAAAALAAAQAAEADARARAEESKARQAAAERAADKDAQRAERLAEQQALIDEPFRDGHWVGPKPKRIEARIDGEFEGWQGNTLFVLDNGQVWRQRLEGRYYHRADSPEVLITRNFMGYFMLRVVATGQRIGVKRLR